MIDIEELRKALEGATDGPWTGHNMTGEDGKQMTPEEIGEYVCNSVKMGAADRFLFVSGKHADGNDCDVCHTGNGPKGPHNTAIIAQAPTLAAFTLEAAEVLDEIVGANYLISTAEVMKEEAKTPGEYDLAMSQMVAAGRQLARGIKKARALLSKHTKGGE